MTVQQPGVALFRTHFLPRSEQFLLQQAQNYSRYRPAFVALERVDRSNSPPASIALHHPGPDRAARLLGDRVWRHVAQTWLRMLLSGGRFQIVHAHFGPDAAVVLPHVLRAAKPLVVTFHGYDATTSRESWLQTDWGRSYLESLPLLFRTSARLVAISDFVASRLVDMGAPERKLVVLPIGTNTNVRFVSQDARVANEVLFVGRLAPVKGAHVLLEAVANLPLASRPIVRILGDGPDRARLTQQAKDLDVAVDFLGMQPHEVVANHMERAAVLVVPSVRAPTGAMEGLGMAIAEAFARGLPVIASASGGITELVRHNETGVVVPEGDAHSLGHALRALLDDPGRAARLAIAARELVRDRYDIGNQTRLLENLYDEVLGTGTTYAT